MPPTHPAVTDPARLAAVRAADLLDGPVTGGEESWVAYGRPAGRSYFT